MKALYAYALLCIFCGAAMGDRGDHVIAKRRVALDKIMIPVVALEDRSLWESADFAWSRAVELDLLELDANKKGISVMIRFPAADVYLRRRVTNPEALRMLKEGRINYRARNIPLTQLLVGIAQRAGYDLYTTSAGVIYCAAGTPPFPNAYVVKGDVWEVLFKVPRDGQNPSKPNKTSLLTTDPSPVQAAMTTTTSTRSRSLAPGQA